MAVTFENDIKQDVCDTEMTDHGRMGEQGRTKSELDEREITIARGRREVDVEIMKAARTQEMGEERIGSETNSCSEYRRAICGYRENTHTTCWLCSNVPHNVLRAKTFETRPHNLLCDYLRLF